ncbi:MAG: hypothetical protein NC915_02535 [Candidatus Omnitrophica bacterium]|nr:hypothetical protein [Candidatus Omnitrophota bacterium]
MKKIILILFVFLNLLFCEDNVDINLKQQLIIDLFNYPKLTESQVDLLYLTADNYWHTGEYNKIFPVFYLITRILPNDINAYVLGGWFLINGIAPKYQGKKKELIKNFAVEFMKEGIKNNPYDYRLYWELAWFYYNEKKYNDALQYLEIAEKYEHPFYIENLKAIVFMRTNEIEKAIKEWEKIREKYPERKEIAEKFIKKLKGE